MALTESQKSLIRSSWKEVDGNLEETGLVMFMKLFTDNPSVVPLFKFAANQTLEELRESKRVQRHAYGVMKTVGAAVGLLDDQAALVTTLQALATRHIKYGAKAPMLEPVGAALLFALEQSLGDQWTPEVKDAWVVLYGAVSSVMAPVLGQ